MDTDYKIDPGDDWDDDWDINFDEPDRPAPDFLASFLLLSRPQWDMAQFARDLLEQWGIRDGEGHPPSRDPVHRLTMNVKSMELTVIFDPEPFPHKEPLRNAEFNYLWDGAVDAVRRQKACVLVGVKGGKASQVERGKLLVKAVATASRQESVLAIWNGEMVFGPFFYRESAELMSSGILPVEDWIWVAFRASGDSIFDAFTVGMHFFGKEEIEILNAVADPEELRNFLLDMAADILENNTKYSEGDVIKFDGKEIRVAERSPGVNLPSQVTTLKIAWASPGNAAGYTENQSLAVNEHIEERFGEISYVIGEEPTPDVRIDICVVPPDEEHDRFTVVTLGMGGYRMNVPEELKSCGEDRAELAISLPEDWKLTPAVRDNPRWIWPVTLLRDLARLPARTDGWLCPGHIYYNRDKAPYASSVKFCASMVVAPRGEDVCVLPGGEKVNFYQVIPLYKEEAEYAEEHGAGALLKKMRRVDAVADPNRPNAMYCTSVFYGEDFTGPIDNAWWQLAIARHLNLPVDELAAYDQIAIYLRWCIERGLVNGSFRKKYPDLIKKVADDPERAGLREFIRDELDGFLDAKILSGRGRLFSGYYYETLFFTFPRYELDIEDYALKYFGPERYKCDEFRGEASLFVPYTEEYYKAMSTVLDERFAHWRAQRLDRDTLVPSQLSDVLGAYLKCECEYFPAMADDDPVTAACDYARRLGEENGRTPVIVPADDEELLRRLVANSNPSRGDDFYNFSPASVRAKRKKLLSEPLPDAGEALEELAEKLRVEPSGKRGKSGCRYAGYYNPETGMTRPLLVAYIPVARPWEVFAYLPVGDHGDAARLMAAAKRWYEEYGAVPVVISREGVEFALPSPLEKGKQARLRGELRVFLPDGDASPPPRCAGWKTEWK